MAYEKQLIAAMNNPQTLRAWREAQFLKYCVGYLRERTGDLKTEAQEGRNYNNWILLDRDALKVELQDARQVNKALRQQLDKTAQELHEIDLHVEGVVALGSIHYEEVERLRAIISRRRFFPLVIDGAIAVAVWGLLLLWLS